jgi:hypothetical protein
MRILLYEGNTTTNILGAYECGFALVPRMTVAIPGGKTYYINEVYKNTTSGAGDPTVTMSILCKRSDLSADSPGVIPLTVEK